MKLTQHHQPTPAINKLNCIYRKKSNIPSHLISWRTLITQIDCGETRLPSLLRAFPIPVTACPLFDLPCGRVARTTCVRLLPPFRYPNVVASPSRHAVATDTIAHDKSEPELNTFGADGRSEEHKPKRNSPLCGAQNLISSFVHSRAQLVRMPV